MDDNAVVEMSQYKLTCERFLIFLSGEIYSKLKWHVSIQKKDFDS